MCISAATIIEDNVFSSAASMSSGNMDTSLPHRTSNRSIFSQSPGPLSRSMQQPRLISVASMSQVALPAATAPQLPKTGQNSMPNPLDALKKLVHERQQHQLLSNSRKRRASFTSSTMMSGKTRIASVFDRPSEMLRQAVQRSAAASSLSAASLTASPVAKKAKVELTKTTTPVATSLLHEACRQGPELTVGEVERLLYQDPGAAARPFRLVTTKRVYNRATHQVDSKAVAEAYRHPLNLAIAYKCCSAVLECLVEAAPQVLNLTDGGSRSLHILLRHKPQDGTSVDMMLLQSPETASWKDSKENNALHTAVLYAVPLQTIRHLVLISPQAVLEKNFHGQAPLDLAQRNANVCSEEVASFLWSQVQELSKENRSGNHPCVYSI